MTASLIYVYTTTEIFINNTHYRFTEDSAKIELSLLFVPSTERRRNGDQHDIKRTSDRKTATIVSVGGEGALRQHFLDMGIIPKAEITMVKYAPMGDPVEVRIHSYELTLRLADAEKITIENIYEKKQLPPKQTSKLIDHPGLGEGGRYHNKEEENPLPEGTI